MSNKNIHNDQLYIEGLLKNDSKVIQSIYKNFSAKVIHYVKTNNGNEDDAKDIIQEVLIIIYNQAKTSGLELTCPFDAYFFLLCKRKWLNALNKVDNKKVTNEDDFGYINKSADDTMQETNLFEEKYQLYETMFLQLGDKCKEVLQLSFTLSSMEEVAAKLNVTYGYVRKKKSICTAELTKLIQQSTVYKALKK